MIQTAPIRLTGGNVAGPSYVGTGQPLPSGQNVDLHEVILEDVAGEAVMRFRFVAPAISRAGGSVSFSEAELDMVHLCETVALPYLAQHSVAAHHVVISLSDRFVEFGSSDPDTTQFFEAFRIENNSCIWEVF